MDQEIPSTSLRAKAGQDVGPALASPSKNSKSEFDGGPPGEVSANQSDEQK